MGLDTSIVKLFWAVKNISYRSLPTTPKLYFLLKRNKKIFEAQIQISQAFPTVADMSWKWIILILDCVCLSESALLEKYGETNFFIFCFKNSFIDINCMYFFYWNVYWISLWNLIWHQSVLNLHQNLWAKGRQHFTILFVLKLSLCAVYGGISLL